MSIVRVELLLLIAAVVAMLARKISLPYTVGLTVTGVVLALLKMPVEIDLTKDLIFTVFLPPLIFEAALQMHWGELRDDAAVILTLATAGVLLAGAVVAAGLYYLAHWPWSAALLLALLISATDPVSVIATFKEAGVQGRLRLLVEAESLFNDGTVAVFYSVALAAMLGGSATAGAITGNLLLVMLGGLLCGGLVGGAVLLLAGPTEDHLIEITLSSVAAYGSFLLAEHLHLSGVLATLTAGVLIGNTSSLGAFTDRGHDAIRKFWEYVGFVANSLIFLLIGIQLVAQNIPAVLTVSGLVILLVLAGRALSVYVCCAPFAGSLRRVTANHQHVLVWGGLRGALALALALGLPPTMSMRDTIVSVTFVVVLFSVVVQGVTMTPLLRRLGELAPRKTEPL